MTNKQKKFARFYALSGNGKQSAIKAGYSERSANSIGSENLTKPDVSEAVAKYRRRNEQKLDELEDLVIAKTHQMIDSDILGAFDCNGYQATLLPIDKWPRALRDSVTEFKTVSLDDGNVGVMCKFTDRAKLMALASKITQMDKVDAQVNLEQGLSVNVNFIGANAR